MKYPTRSMHILDIENLCEHKAVNLALAEQALLDYRKEIEIKANDLVVVSASKYNSMPAYIAAHRIHPGCRTLPPRKGPDAADLSLIEALANTPNLETFDCVYIASGDHIFAPVHAALASRGIKTVAVARTGACSAKVRLAAQELVKLPHYQQVRLATVTYIHSNKKAS